MGIVEEVNKLHVTLKSIIISMVLTMPFWYLNLYFFKNDFFLSSPIQIPIIISFCLSVVWTGLHFLSASSFEIAFMKKQNTNSDSKIEGTVLLAVIVSLMWIAIYTFLTYYFKWSFMNLFYISFGGTIIKTSVYIIIGWLLGKKMN